MERKTYNKQHPAYSRLNNMGSVLTDHMPVAIVPQESPLGLLSRQRADTSLNHINTLMMEAETVSETTPSSHG
jgi:hypothetical protein